MFEQHRYVLVPLTPYRLQDIDYVMLLTFGKYTEFQCFIPVEHGGLLQVQGNLYGFIEWESLRRLIE